VGQEYVNYDDPETGIRFVFKTEPGHPDMLHIYARHLTEPVDAIEAFFDGQRVWNQQRNRFETTTDTHTLYWYWLKEEAVVMVVSCFRSED
jgi:hypothetical protein